MIKHDSKYEMYDDVAFPVIILNEDLSIEYSIQ